MFTVTVGKAKVAVAVTVDDGVIVGVNAVVGVSVSVGVRVIGGTLVFVHEAAVVV